MNIVFVYDVPEEETFVLVRGQVGGWFRGRRIPAYRTNINNGWWLRRDRLDDVLADMELSGIYVRYTHGRAPRYVPPTMPRPESETAA